MDPYGVKLQEVDGEQNPGFTNNVENEDPPPPYDIGLMEYNNPGMILFKQ